MMSPHSNNCCVVHEPAICEDLDLHVAIFTSACKTSKRKVPTINYHQKWTIYFSLLKSTYQVICKTFLFSTEFRSIECHYHMLKTNTKDMASYVLQTLQTFIYSSI